jgi:hypothetical protein
MHCWINACENRLDRIPPSPLSETSHKSAFPSRFFSILSPFASSTFEAKAYDKSLFPSCSFAAATTLSGSKPNFLWSSLSGAEAPNVFMPMTRPVGPT